MNPSLSNKKLIEAQGFVQSQDFARALPAYEKLIRQFAHSAQVWLEYGVAAAGAGQADLAERAWNKAAQLQPRHPLLLLEIGHNFQRLRQLDRARAWFEKAAAVGPKDINPRICLAVMFEKSHRFAEAREAVASCLAIDPRDDQARYFSALLDRRENKIEDAERKLRDLIASGPRHQYVQYAVRYELAQVLDRTERYDEAMQALAEAKSYVRRIGDTAAMLRDYDRELADYRGSTQCLPKNILRTWAAEFPESAREPMPRMAFLGGHPRSGTTLLEQVLGAHPEVAAMDEPQTFTSVVCPLLNNAPVIDSSRLNVMRRRYLEGSRREWGGNFEGKLLLDKNPSPTAYLRVWLRVFPELRVLVALRDPRDVVISCYFQNIMINPHSANFLTLERGALHYANLMDVWLTVRQWEGLTALETRYEDIVADLAKEGRRVTEFLGLTWDPQQERFYEKSGKNKQMYSPTYHDASQPVYARAVARWHAYEKHLAPVLPALEPYCRALGYT